MKVQNVNDTISTAPIVQQPTSASIGNVAKSTLVSGVKESQQPSTEQLQASIKQISDDLKKSQVNLDFSIDKSSKEVVVKVIDSSTGDVLTQFPSKQALAISEIVASQKKGAFLNKMA
jgi:flagellar protein FlaG